MTLEESIRYKPGDDVEKWLTNLLCLDATNIAPLLSGCPPPDICDLYYINRDTLFCYHKASEAFLQRIVSLYVASHYKVNILNNLFIFINYFSLLNYYLHYFFLINRIVQMIFK